MEINKITEMILEAAFKVHSKLGPGLLESVYKTCLAYEIKKSGLTVEVEKTMSLVYDDLSLDCGYRIDLLVENQIVVELKAVDEINDVHIAQTLTYMKLSGKKVGLLLNFNTKSLENGIKRLVL